MYERLDHLKDLVCDKIYNLSTFAQRLSRILSCKIGEEEGKVWKERFTRVLR